MPYKSLSLDEAKTLMNEQETTLADIRDPQSYAERHIENSVNVLDHNLDNFLINTGKEKPLIVYCYHGNNSRGAADYFFGKGFKEVYNLEGGFEAWRLKY